MYSIDKFSTFKNMLELLTFNNICATVVHSRSFCSYGSYVLVTPSFRGMWWQKEKKRLNVAGEGRKKGIYRDLVYLLPPFPHRDQPHVATVIVYCTVVVLAWYIGRGGRGKQRRRRPNTTWLDFGFEGLLLEPLGPFTLLPSVKGVLTCLYWELRLLKSNSSKLG